MSRLTFEDLTPDDMPPTYRDDSGDIADAHRDSLADLSTERSPLMSAKEGVLVLPLRAENTGPPKIRIVDANGDTIAYVYYPLSDYEENRTLGDALTTRRAIAMIEACNSHAQLQAERDTIAAELAALKESTSAQVWFHLTMENHALKGERDGMREALEKFVAIMDSEEDGGEGIFEERLERLLPEAMAALAGKEGK